MKTNGGILSIVLIVSAMSSWHSRLVAQPPPLPKIVDVQIGFKSHAADRLSPTHKVGLWTPVSVRVQGGALRYEKTTGDGALALVLECEDSEDCLTITRLPIVLDAGAEKTVVAYIKPGQIRGDLRVSSKRRVVQPFPARPSSGRQAIWEIIFT